MSDKKIPSEDLPNTQPYKVLARKYRPSHFDELIGQDALVRTLTNAIETGRIAHAYMLTGVRGVGKTTTARIIAKALNYTGADGKAGPITGPTDDCEMCQAIAADRHPDVLEMDAASRTGVDDIREILDGVRYAPVSARYKVYIIDEVHMLSKQAFNALLKTLEEPPEQVIFIFATTEIRKVPVTVLSRCQRFDLRRVGAAVLKDYYKTICDREQVEAEDDALALIGQAADGSVRDGLSLLDQAIAQSAGALTLDHVQNMLGLADRGKTLSMLEHALMGNSAASLTAIADLFANGADPQMVLQDLLDITHLLSRYNAVYTAQNAGKASSKNGDAETDIDFGPDMTQKAKDIAAQISMPSLGRAWDILMKGMHDLQSAPNPERSAEMTIIRLSYAANMPDPVKILRDIDAGNFDMGGYAPMPAGGGAPSSTHMGLGGAVQGSSVNQTAPSSAMRSSAVMAGGASGQGAQCQAQAQYLEIVPPNMGSDPKHDSQPAQKHWTSQELTTLEIMVKAFEANGFMRVATDVRYFVSLVSLRPGQLDIYLTDQAPKTLPGDIKKILGQITGDNWAVSIGNKMGEMTLSDQEKKAHEDYMIDIKSQPLVNNVLEMFPGAQIRDIYSKTSLNEDGDD